MAHDDRHTNGPEQPLTLTRRALLQGALAAGGGIGLGASPVFAAQEGSRRATSAVRPASTNRTLALARLLNAVKYEDLSPTSIEYAKVIIASTLASAAFGWELGSSKAMRELAKEAAGKPEAT